MHQSQGDVHRAGFNAPCKVCGLNLWLEAFAGDKSLTERLGFSRSDTNWLEVDRGQSEITRDGIRSAAGLSLRGEEEDEDKENKEDDGKKNVNE